MTRIWVLYAFFWVIPPRLNFICRRFGTLCLFYFHRRRSVEWLYLRNVGSFIGKGLAWKWPEQVERKAFSLWIPLDFLNIVILHLSAYEDGTECLYNSDAGELPRRKHTTFRTRRKFEIKKNMCILREDQYTFFIVSCSDFLRMRNVSDTSCRENKNTHIMFCHFFENSAVYETMWKILQGLAGNRCQYGTCALNAG